MYPGGGDGGGPGLPPMLLPLLPPPLSAPDPPLPELELGWLLGVRVVMAAEAKVDSGQGSKASSCQDSMYAYISKNNSIHTRIHIHGKIQYIYVFTCSLETGNSVDFYITIPYITCTEYMSKFNACAHTHIHIQS